MKDECDDDCKTRDCDGEKIPEAAREETHRCRALESSRGGEKRELVVIGHIQPNETPPKCQRALARNASKPKVTDEHIPRGGDDRQSARDHRQSPT